MERVNTRIYLSTPTMHEEELHYIQEAFEKNWVAPLGFNCDGLEKEVAAYLSESEKWYALALVSGTSALHLAVKLAGIGQGDVVLCSDMTFSATINPIVYEGGVPVFVDSEYDTWNMDPAALEKAFEKYPEAKAVMLVHLYGTPAKMEEIQAICRRHGAVLIEDTAEALSATYNGQKCGTFGDFGAVSFNGNKIITTSGGGMLLTKDKNLRQKALFWATQAREDAVWYEHKEIGYNYRMSNVVAGIGRGQLKHLEEHRERKERIYRRYQKAFAGLPVTMNPYLENSRPNFWLSCFTVNKGCAVAPLTVIQKLREKNIEARPVWKPMHMQPVFAGQEFITAAALPVNEDLFARGICLPSDIKMTEDEQDRVIAIVRACFEQG